MRVTGQSKSRVLGYVQVRVASRVYTLPVEAARPVAVGETAPEHGFFAHEGDRLGILVDEDASDNVQRAVIERASADAVRHLSRRLLN
jgi:hypothetical protein